MIKQAYLSQVAHCGASPAQAESLWLQIEAAYTEDGRFYHDLSHIEHLYTELRPLRFEDWPTLFFSLVYHDIVYHVEQHMVLHDNEERSADLAEAHLKCIHYPPEKIQMCRQQILATKTHSGELSKDAKLLIDADLSILGKPWPVYDAYRRHVRQEYQVYQDSVFNAGRRKIVTYYLEMEPLYKTSHFRKLYEAAAKENLRRELQLLQE